MKKHFTAKDIEKIQALAQDIISLDAPMKSAEGEESTMGDLIPSDDLSPEEECINSTRRENLYDAFMKCLKPREIKVMTMRFGLDGGSTMTLQEIGDMYNITRERVRQIELTALKKLRNFYYANGITGDMM